jgi:phenylpropionate dioxygenase-like ring-hydroxylating dioxygenase large terminal subunit
MTYENRASKKLTIPQNCTFTPSDWQILSRFWYPIALQGEILDQPIAITLLDQPLVIWRSPSGISVADDRCPHRGIPLSMGHMLGENLVCPYHGLHYNATGQCTQIPAHPGATVPPQLCLKIYPVIEAYGLVWTTLTGELLPDHLPDFSEWNDPNYQQILPDSLFLQTSAGRQMEGFLDVSHFAWVHTETFGDRNNPIVPRYEVTRTDRGLIANYFSTVSNFPKGLEHLAPEGFEWQRVFEVFLPFSARLTVHFPGNDRLCILNLASPISSQTCRMFAPICRNFDQEASLEPVYEFNRQVFAEDQAMIEAQHPKELPLDIRAEAHIRADRTSIAYRKGLRNLGLGNPLTKA